MKVLFAPGLLSVVLMLTIAAPSTTGRGNQHQTQPGSRDPNSLRTQNCKSSAEISEIVEGLSTGKLSDRQDGVKRLIKESRESNECRKRVISEVMAAMDRPNLDFTTDQTSYDMWVDGSELLGELKATEALDLLIAHLDLDNGDWNGSMIQQPALTGVIKMGPVAVPKLAVVLRSNPERYMRWSAVFCIAQIGGVEAKRALKTALPSESDHCVHNFIRVSIDFCDRVQSPNGIELDTVKWRAAAQCS